MNVTMLGCSTIIVMVVQYCEIIKDALASSRKQKVSMSEKEGGAAKGFRGGE